MDFYTELLQLGGKAKIPSENYLYDIKEKITIKLREALLPTQSQHRTYKDLAIYLTSLDNGSRVLDADKERYAAAVARKKSATPQASRAPYNSAGGQHGSAYIKQETPVCHNCQKPGHFVKDCLAPKASIKELEVDDVPLHPQQLDDFSDVDDDSGNESA